jgi:pimeloyl-[acyl-carrier protein] methyl ester esterase
MIVLPDLQFTQLKNGQKIAWREWGKGTPLVMLHGWSMSSAVFSEVALLLADHYRLLCPDIPGHGGSDSISNCSLDGFAQSILEWLRYLDLDQFQLLGWSLGGQIAIHIATHNPAPLEKMILVAGTPCFCQIDGWQYGLPEVQVKVLDRNLSRVYEKTMSDFFYLQFIGEELSPERYRQIIAFAVCPVRLPEPFAARETLKVLGQSDQRESLADVRCPTLVMHGELDRIVPVGAGDYLAAEISESSLIRLPDIGHAPFFSRPQEVVAQWHDFLQ